MDREFDIVLYGATGYTGALIAELFASSYTREDPLRWALAGRSLDKLRATRDSVGAAADLPLLLADSDDTASLRAMCERARVVISTVGPYQLYGSDLVGACAASGTAYVDLCGEPAWMRKMIDAYEDTAKRTGARITFSCGFDSIPFDLGVLTLQEAVREKFGRPASRVRGRVRRMVGGFSGGTAASLKATVAAAAHDPHLVSLLASPFALTPGFEGPPQPKGLLPEYDAQLGVWTAPFIMAPINTKNVHRTNFLLQHAYGRDFVYDEMIVAPGIGERGKMAAQALAKANPLAGNRGPKPGEGPSKEEREAGSYEILFVADTPDGGQMEVIVTGDRDPGYGSTSKMIIESALCLLRDNAGHGGIWTPGALMGPALRNRLQDRAGLTFRKN